MRLRFLAFGVLLTTVAACDSGFGPGESGEPITVRVMPASVYLLSTEDELSLSAQVLDGWGSEVSGVEVQWRSTNPEAVAVSEDGVVSAEAPGRARVTATAGPATGSATVVALAGPRIRSGEFRMELHYATEAPERVRKALERGAARWEEVVLGDLPSVRVQAGAGECGEGSPEVRREVDDLLVLVQVEEIDGPGGTLASAGPCAVREGTTLPVMGRVRLDEDDVERLDDMGVLDAVVLHELGHVLGIGALWSRTPFLANPSLPDARGADTHFAGPAAVAAFDAVGGRDADISKVPVENREGSRGTRDTHWRMQVFGHELMTGFVRVGDNPLSRVTVASLEDLGYRVEQGAAEPFQVGPFPPLAPGVEAEEPVGILLEKEPPSWPIQVLDPDGVPVDVLFPSGPSP